MSGAAAVDPHFCPQGNWWRTLSHSYCDPCIPAAGWYEVFLWWTTYPSRLAEVPVTVRHASGERTVWVNQLVDGGRWNSVGIFDLAASGTVRIRSPGGGTVCADAVSFVPLMTPGP
mgnify:CR=1 FL=1